jgi:nucleotide-binding universal stress UspA family protein
MKILVGYEGSNSAKEALRLAITHAKAFEAEVIVITSLTGGSITEEAEIGNANDHLAEAEKMFKDAGIPCETHLLVRGMQPGEDIVNFAAETKADAIIIGVKRRSKVGKLLFGSNAQYVILKAHCPVTTVK